MTKKRSGSAATTGDATAPHPRRRRLKRSQWAALYEQLYSPMVRDVRWDFGLSSEDAEDVVQETFEMAMRKISPQANSAAWLSRAARHIASNLRRTVARRNGLLAKWTPTVFEERKQEDTSE